MKSLIATLCFLMVTLSQVNTVCSGGEPKGAEQHIKEAMGLYAKGQHDLAIKELDEAVRLAPKNAMAFSCRGAIRFAKKEYDLAITDLNEAIRLEPKEASSGYYIGGAAWYMKKEYAKGGLDEAIRLNPKDPEALNSRAWAAATCPEGKFRDRAKALDYAKRACEIDAWKNPFYLGTVAAAYAANSDFKNAVRWQVKAMEDPSYQKACGEEGRRMLKLFEQKKLYIEAAISDK